MDAASCDDEMVSGMFANATAAAATGELRGSSVGAVSVDFATAGAWVELSASASGRGSASDELAAEASRGISVACGIPSSASVTAVASTESNNQEDAAQPVVTVSVGGSATVILKPSPAVSADAPT